jgi:hypothetical protein
VGVALDVMKVFPSVWWEALSEELRRRGVAEELMHL